MRRLTRGLTHGLTVLLAGVLAVATRAPAQGVAPSGRSMLVVIAGAAGEPQYGDAFHKAALAIADAARARFALADPDVVYLGEDVARAPGRIGAVSTRENVERTLTSLAARARPGDQLWIVLVGHGSSEGTASRFNVPGPDISAADFARLLAPFAQQKIAFVDATSASADFVKALAAPNRAIVAATTSPSERNVTRFARYFADALATPNADLDKDGGVSLLEAFTYARRETVRSYESENRMLTEHAQLDDDGDGVGSDTPSVDANDGRLAAAIVLGGVPASSDARVGSLVAKRRALEIQVAELRRRRPQMDSTAYLQQLETVLVDLSRTAHTIRGLEGKP
jgi:hypothetical protein